MAGPRLFRDSSIQFIPDNGLRELGWLTNDTKSDFMRSACLRSVTSIIEPMTRTGRARSSGR